MPHKPKLRRRRRPGEWNDTDRLMLRFGADILGLGDGNFGSLDDPAAIQCWEDIGHEVLDDVIRGGAGKRPAAWWHFVAFATHGPRLKIAFDAFGIDEADAMRPPKDGDAFETSEAFLRRNGLLETGEFFRLRRQPKQRET